MDIVVMFVYKKRSSKEGCDHFISVARAFEEGVTAHRPH